MLEILLWQGRAKTIPKRNNKLAQGTYRTSQGYSQILRRVEVPACQSSKYQNDTHCIIK